MNGIDLTQCNNCRFRAVVDGKEVTGWIEKSKTGFLLTGNDWFGCVVSYLELATLYGGNDIITDDGDFRISGFEIVPRDPETYKDWQVEDKVCEKDNKDSIYRVIFRSGDMVVTASDGDRALVYTCNELYNDDCRLVLTDIEKRIVEGRKQKPYEFRKGEPVLVRNVPEGKWLLSTFVRYNQINSRPFCASNGTDPIPFLYCLPYNEKTMHLLGTTEDYKDD